MKDVKLKELTIYHWKGINAHHVFGDNENKVSGRNRSGKTTILRAWNWLLSGYSDSETNANSDLFDNREEITKDTPKASVFAIVTIDGQQHAIERTAEAKFTRKRGTDIYEKASSDSYQYFIDSLEYNATDFKNWLTNNICEETMLRYILGGDFFISEVFSDKKKARQLLETVVGEVTREEMTGNYDIIDGLIGQYTLDQIEAQASNLIKGINKRLDEIPVLIQNKQTEMAVIEQTDFNENNKRIEELEKEQKECDEKLFDLSARMKPLLEAKANAESAKRMKEEVYKKAETEYQRSFIEQDNELVKQISIAEKENADKEKRIKTLSEYISNKEKLIEEWKQKLAELRTKRDTEKERQFDGSDVCPVCGNKLTPEQMAPIMEEFESKKRVLVDEIVAEGKRTAAHIEELEAQIQLNKDELATIFFTDTNSLRVRLENLRKQDILSFAETEQGKILQADIDGVVIPEVVMPDDDSIKKQKAEISRTLVPLYETRGLQRRLNSLKDEVETLRADQKQKGQDLARYERQRQQVLDYRQEQMQILSRKINNDLAYSHIDVWSAQKDGTMVPDLVIKDSQGVSYSTTNNASRIVTSIDIQRFFCNKLGVNMPCFIDEATIVNADNLPMMDGVQMFYLFCSETALKIESK